MVLQEKEKNILAILSVILVICTYWLLLRPAIGTNQDLKKSVAQYKREIGDPEQSKHKVKELQAEVDSIKKEISALRDQLPSTEKREFLIRDLEALARKNNIELISFMPKDAVPVTMAGKEITPRMLRSKKKLPQNNLEEMHAKVLRTAINIDSQGRFEDYNNFFADVITYYRAVEISDIIMAKGASAGMGQDKRFAPKTTKNPLQNAQNNRLSVSFTLLAYTSIDEMMQNQGP